MRISTMRELMCILREHPRIEILAHQNAEHIGEIRRVTVVQEASFYSAIEGQSEHPVSRRHYGRGSDIWLYHPSCLSIQDDVCTVRDINDVRNRKESPRLFVQFRILEDD